MLSVSGIISHFVLSSSAKLRTREMVGKVGTYCAAHSGPRAAWLYSFLFILEFEIGKQMAKGIGITRDDGVLCVEVDYNIVRK